MTTEPSDGHEPEDPASVPAAPGGLSSGKKIIIATVGALVLVAGGVLIGGQLGGEEDPAAQATPIAEAPAPSEPTAEAPVTPGSQETAEPQPTTPAEVIAAIDVKKAPDDILELGTYSLLSSEAQAKMHSLYDMDVATFRDQPYEDQVAFGMQILDNMRPIIDYELSENNIDDLHYTDSPTTTQEIQDNSTYIQITAARLITEKELNSFVYDNELALKLESILQDVRVTTEGRMDEMYGQFTIATMPSFRSMHDSWKATVSNESATEDGTITYTETVESGEKVTVQIKPVTYTSMLDGSSRQLSVVVDAQIE